MNDTDSLLVFRLQRLRNQPKTIRGRCILFYASLNDRPCARIMLALGFILFVMAHALAFCSMLYACYVVSQLSLSSNLLFNPVLTLPSGQ